MRRRIMPARLKWALDRVSRGRRIVWPRAARHRMMQSADYIAGQVQTALVGHLFTAWPEIDGRPLWPSADSDVACWCLDGRPWCAIGQLDQAQTRIENDFSGLPIDLPTVAGNTITAHGMTFTGDAPLEELVAAVADQLQDDVVDNLGRTWPEVSGRPLFASAASGVACWCLDGRPWCAIGQLDQALASHEAD